MFTNNIVLDPFIVSLYFLFCILIWFGYNVVTINVYKKIKDIQDNVDIKNTRHMIKISRH